MSSASEARSFPYTNDVGTTYENPEKPPVEEELPSPQTAGQSSASSPITVNTIQPQPTFPLPNYDSPLSSARSETSTSLPHYDFATETVNNTTATFERFVIPTRNDALSSGFPYDPRIYDMISHDEWHLLTSDIVSSAKLSFGEDLAAWTTGITTGTLTSPFLLVAGPFVGYYAGRAVHRKTVVKTAKERLDRDGDLRSVLRRWNETKFASRGFQVWLELPVDGDEVALDAKSVEKQKEKKSKKQKKAEKKTFMRFRIVIIPNTGKLKHSRSFGEGWGVQVTSPVSAIDIPTTVEAPGREHMDPVEMAG